jgi:hypothetical protein
VYRDLTGDGSISAHVGSISEVTAINVKAGVMMRDAGGDGVGANDVYASHMVKPTRPRTSSSAARQRRRHHLDHRDHRHADLGRTTPHRQHRTSASHRTTAPPGPTIGSDTSPMAPRQGGLAVTSHTVAALATVAFTNVVLAAAGGGQPYLQRGHGHLQQRAERDHHRGQRGSVRYTVDGSDPTPTSGTVYSTPISVSVTGTVLKAIAYKTAWPTARWSAPATPSRRRRHHQPRVPARTAAPERQPLVGDDASAAIYYTLDAARHHGQHALHRAINVATTRTVKAIAAGPAWGISGVTSATFTINATPVTVNASADAYVRDGTSAATSYGTLATLEVKNSSVVNNGRVTYVRFSIGALAGTVSNAKLRLYGSAILSAKDLSVYSVANLTWAEASINWNTAPPSGSSKLATVTVALTAQYWEWDRPRTCGRRRRWVTPT